MVARVIDEIDDENWLMMFVQELEVHVKQIIQMEKKIKQLIHQAREGRADGYKELIKVLLQFLNFSNSNGTKTKGPLDVFDKKCIWYGAYQINKRIFYEAPYKFPESSRKMYENN